MAMLTFMYPHHFWHLWTAPAFKLQQIHLWEGRKSQFLSGQGAEGADEHQQWAPTLSPEEQGCEATREAVEALSPSAPQEVSVEVSAGEEQQVLCSTMAWTDPVLKFLGSHWLPLFSPSSWHRPSTLEPTEIPTHSFTCRLHKRLFLPQIEE